MIKKLCRGDVRKCGFWEATGKARKECKALSYGSYKELMLTITSMHLKEALKEKQQL